LDFNNISKPHLFQLSHLPDKTRVLVLSPHPDDETYGCGGALIEHRRLGHKVCVVILTDGSKGYKIKKDGNIGVIEIRKKEALNAIKILDIDQLIFFDFEDKNIKLEQSEIDKLRSVLINFNPNIIYLPHFNDNHIDHYHTNVLLFLCNDLLKSRNITIMAYEIWSLMRPNVYVNISDHFNKKVQAMSCYKSQQDQVDYINMITGLNIMRGSQANYFSKKAGINIVTFAEGYFKTDLANYWSLANFN
jgi:LmbE family N-acetylglucosaminyl deacetylase